MSNSPWKFFTNEELNCSHCGEANPNPEFNALMNDILPMRYTLGFSLPVSSGYRCPNHPIELAKVADGRSLGSHTIAAIDINVYHEQAYKLLDLAFATGFTGIGINQKGDYNQRFIHLDNRPISKARVWSY